MKTLEAGEEGSVLYIAKRYNNDQESLVSMLKLKTIEYRIFRKLREKLRTLVSSDKASFASTLEKFSGEIKNLKGELTLPRSLEEYAAFAKKALDFVEKYPQESYLIHKQFVSFLSIV